MKACCRCKKYRRCAFLFDHMMVSGPWTVEADQFVSRFMPNSKRLCKLAGFPYYREWWVIWAIHLNGAMKASNTFEIIRSDRVGILPYSTYTLSGLKTMVDKLLTDAGCILLDKEEDLQKVRLLA